MPAQLHIQIIVPFQTSLTTEPDPHEQDGIFCQDEDLTSANTEITGIYPVQDAEDAAPLLAAAELLGFACSYANSNKKEDEYAVVVIRFAGVQQADT